MDRTWDCIVVGAGAAGLSAALVLGRARQRTLVVDAGRQSNLAAEGIGGLLGHDHRPPQEYYAAGRGELAHYPAVTVRAGEIVEGERDGDGFVLELADGTREAAPRVLLATGMDYRHPELPGMAERWGRTVFHCPFCHGWEVRDRRLGVLGSSLERALLLSAWSEDVTLYAGEDLDAADRERLDAAGIAVEERPVAAVRDRAVVLADGAERPCDALLVPVTTHQRSSLAARLGAATVEGPIAADAVEVDAMFETTVAGLFAAGDASAQMPSVANAVAAGSTAAAGIVRGMVLSR